MVLLAWMYSCVSLLISLLTLPLPAGVVKKKKTFWHILLDKQFISHFQCHLPLVQKKCS